MQTRQVDQVQVSQKLLRDVLEFVECRPPRQKKDTNLQFVYLRPRLLIVVSRTASPVGVPKRTKLIPRIVGEPGRYSLMSPSSN